jgi:hypothetical protein
MKISRTRYDSSDMPKCDVESEGTKFPRMPRSLMSLDRPHFHRASIPRRIRQRSLRAAILWDLNTWIHPAAMSEDLLDMQLLPALYRTAISDDHEVKTCPLDSH